MTFDLVSCLIGGVIGLIAGSFLGWIFAKKDIKDSSGEGEVIKGDSEDKEQEADEVEEKVESVEQPEPEQQEPVEDEAVVEENPDGEEE